MSQAHTTPALMGFLSCGQSGQRVNNEVRCRPDIFQKLTNAKKNKGRADGAESHWGAEGLL